MNTPFNKAILRPGDCILYRPSGIFDYAVALKTWTYVSHVECYIGAGMSVASRNGKGVDRYAFRADHVAAVRRPGPAFDMIKAMAWFYSEAQGDKYGWWTLSTFCLLNNNPIEGHQICSEFATNWYDAGQCQLFDYNWPAYRTPPSLLVSTRALTTIWDDGHLFN